MVGGGSPLEELNERITGLGRLRTKDLGRLRCFRLSMLPNLQEDLLACQLLGPILGFLSRKAWGWRIWVSCKLPDEAGVGVVAPLFRATGWELPKTAFCLQAIRSCWRGGRGRKMNQNANAYSQSPWSRFHFPQCPAVNCNMKILSGKNLGNKQFINFKLCSTLE